MLNLSLNFLADVRSAKRPLKVWQTNKSRIKIEFNIKCLHTNVTTEIKNSANAPCKKIC